MKFTGEYKILGRGLVYTMTMDDSDPVIHCGDLIPHDGKLYEVRGIEMSRIMTAPPRLSPHVGFVVREVKPTLRMVLEKHADHPLLRVYTVNAQQKTEYIGNPKTRANANVIARYLDCLVDKEIEYTRDKNARCIYVEVK